MKCSSDRLSAERNGLRGTATFVVPSSQSINYSGSGNTIRVDVSFFELFAECSIALAGFGAVHAVLRGSTGARGIFRAWFVVTQGALSFLLSVLPLLLMLTPLSGESLWRIASAFGVAGTAAANWWHIAFDIQLTRLGSSPQATKNLRLSQLINALAVLAMLANLLGLPWSPAPHLYAAAVTLLLTAGLIALVQSFLLPLQLVLSGKDSRAPVDPTAA